LADAHPQGCVCGADPDLARLEQDRVTYRKEVPLEFADQCVLGRSKVKDSLVLGLMIWNVAPTFVGSSPLPGVGRMKGPRDRKLSLPRDARLQG